MTDAQLTELIDKYLSGNCGTEEKQLIEQWYEDLDTVPLQFHGQDSSAINESAKRSLEAIRQKIAIKKAGESRGIIAPMHRKNAFRWLHVAAAAVIIFILSDTIYLLLPVRTGQKRPVAAIARRYKNDISPGGNKAVLTLANGSTIILDSAQNGTLTQQGNTKVLKLNSGQLSYESLNGKPGPEIQYNLLTTPRGGQYQLRLPDGTQVWLNAASSIRYPTAFTGKEREVEITGEAYFEVVNNKDQPFKVHVGDIQIEDMGTHFDVMAYNDEAAIKTTLLEGAVKVTNGTANILLQPGQQAIVDKKTATGIKVKKADVDEVLAWKNGEFSFNNTDIYSVMRQLSRWYDLEVNYQDSSDVYLNGNIKMNVNASQVFKMIELTGEVQFKIDGKKITLIK